MRIRPCCSGLKEVVNQHCGRFVLLSSYLLLRRNLGAPDLFLQRCFGGFRSKRATSAQRSETHNFISRESRLGRADSSAPAVFVLFLQLIEESRAIPSSSGSKMRLWGVALPAGSDGAEYRQLQVRTRDPSLGLISAHVPLQI